MLSNLTAEETVCKGGGKGSPCTKTAGAMSAPWLPIETCLEASGQVEGLTAQVLGFVRVSVRGMNGWTAL